jgi:4'-phosphopantetheinyl transferase
MDQEKIGGDIHVWHAPLDCDGDFRAQLEATLSPDELERAKRFHFAKDGNRYVVARGLLRKLLGGYLHRPPADLEFSYGEYGKPDLSGLNASSGYSFNLSHSAGVVVFAIGKERNLGIDVELIKPDSAGEDIARRFFSPSEVSDLQTLPPESRAEAFFRCWTRKEAYLKARGKGLQIPLDTFSVSLRPGGLAQFLSGVDSQWQIAGFSPAEGYVAAVVYDGPPCAIKYFTIDSQ